MTPLISIKDLSVKYDDVVALKDINITIEDKKFITIIGPNGGGKTTLIKTIIGFIPSYKGTIEKRSGLRIGYVPQKNNFEEAFPISVKQVILSGTLNEPVKLFHRFKEPDFHALNHVLETLNISKLKDKAINSLSGGELQKVLLGRAIISNPDLLVLDEPFSNVDTNATKEYYELLRDLSKKMSVIIISHDIGVISTYTDDVICMNKTAHYHKGNKVSNELFQKTYGCPIELIGHGIPHRVFPQHHGGDLNVSNDS